MTTVTIQDTTDTAGFTATVQDTTTAITPLLDSGTDTSGGDDIYQLPGGALELATIVDRDDGSKKDVSNIGTGGGGSIEAQEDGTTLTTSIASLNWAAGLTATEPTTDDIQIDVDESEVDHNTLLNYVANEHIDHSGVSITAGTLLSGGGDLTTSRTLNVDEGSISHDAIDQATVSADDHHTKYTDSEAVTAVNNDVDHGSTASHNYFSGSHADLSNITADDHHVKYTDEEARDAAGAALTGGTNVSVTVDDAADTHTIDATDTDTQRTDEEIEDVVGALVGAAGNISVTYDDVGNTLTVDTSALNTEEVEDAVSALLTTDSNLALSYDDANDSLEVGLASSVNVGTLSVGGSTALQAVVASGQVTLSSNTAVVDTGLSATDATFYVAFGIDDPNADAKVTARLFWDDSAGTYKIEIVEDGTSVGNPTVNYDVLRVR